MQSNPLNQPGLPGKKFMPRQPQLPSPRGQFIPNGLPSPSAASAQDSLLNLDQASQAACDWPESLQNYVQRAFSSADSKEEKDLVQEKLKDKLSNVLRLGMKDSVDWDSEPLPWVRGNDPQTPSQFVSRKERKSRWDSEGNTENSAPVVTPSPTVGRFQRGRGRGRFNHMRNTPVASLRRKVRSRSRSSSGSRGNSRSPSPRSRRSPAQYRRDRDRRKKRRSR